MLNINGKSFRDPVSEAAASLWFLKLLMSHDIGALVIPFSQSENGSYNDESWFVDNLRPLEEEALVEFLSDTPVRFSCSTGFELNSKDLVKLHQYFDGEGCFRADVPLESLYELRSSSFEDLHTIFLVAVTLAVGAVANGYIVNSIIDTHRHLANFALENFFSEAKDFLRVHFPEGFYPGLNRTEKIMVLDPEQSAPGGVLFVYDKHGSKYVFTSLTFEQALRSAYLAKVSLGFSSELGVQAFKVEDLLFTCIASEGFVALDVQPPGVSAKAFVQDVFTLSEAHMLTQSAVGEDALKRNPPALTLQDYIKFVQSGIRSLRALDNI